MTRLRKSYADVKREVRAQLARGASEERTLAPKNSAHPEALLSAVEGPVEGAPNALPSAVEGQREFGINDDYAWELFRPEPSMLPNFPMTRHNPVERDG